MSVSKNVEWWYLLDRNNRYFGHINECRNKDYSQSGEVHIHHIIPKAWFRTRNAEELAYMDSQENLIPLSVTDHVRAHELLYEIYKNPGDLAAVQMLKGDKVESRRIWRRAGAYASHAAQKANGSTFYDSEFQREMAYRSLARPDALQIRSEGGTVGGRNRNKGRAIKKEDRYIFYYKNVEVFCILNCETGGDVLEILNLYKATPLQRATPLLNGSRKSLHGWSCEKL
jgi:hypothetical protein